MIKFEQNNFCMHCGEPLREYEDDITIRDGAVYHTICLPENLKDAPKE